MIGRGYFQVTGDSRLGIGLSGGSAVQPSAAGSGFPRPMAEKPMPEFPVPVAVTRHLEMFLTFALLH